MTYLFTMYLLLHNFFTSDYHKYIMSAKLSALCCKCSAYFGTWIEGTSPCCLVTNVFRTFSAMFNYTLFKLSITRADIRPQVTCAVNLVTKDCNINREVLRGFCGYVWVKIPTLSQPIVDMAKHYNIQHAILPRSFIQGWSANFKYVLIPTTWLRYIKHLPPSIFWYNYICMEF